MWPVTVGILALTGIGLAAGVLLKRRKPAPIRLSKAYYWVLVVLVTAAIIVAAALAFRGAAARPPTVYFVLDATGTMTPFFGEVSNQVRLTTMAMPAGVKVGLRIYGGQASGVIGCRDTTQLVQPAAYEDLAARLDSALSGIVPGGHSSLTGAVLNAIYDDLAEHRGPLRLIIITSGPDSECDPPESGILESRAKDIGADVDVLIVSVGDLNASDRFVLNSYATAFGGNYLHIGTADELPRVIESVSSYGSNYLLEQSTPDIEP